MSNRRSLLSGVLVVCSGQGLVQLLMLGRNVVLARLLGPAEMGSAAALVITASLLDMISNLSADKLLIQAADGDSPRFQATAQAIHVIRGVVQAMGLVLLGGTAAMLFRVPHAAMAFRLLAIAPFMRGLEHLDADRIQRDGRFVRSMLVDVVPQLIGLLVAVVSGLRVADHRAALWAILAQAVTSMAMTHLLARQSYRWAWDRQYSRRIFSFGTPLLFNGILLFAIVQGERMLVGSVYGPELLGNYSVAFMVGFAPTMMLANVATSLLLPRFSSALRSGRRWRETYMVSAVALAMLTAVLGIGLVTLGQPALVAVFGRNYARAGSLVAVLAMAQVIRLQRVVPTLAAMAYGDTHNTLWANLVRCLTLGVAIPAVLHGADVLWVGAWGSLGEGAALLMSTRRLARRQGQSPAWTLWPTVLVMAGLSGAAIWAKGQHSPLELAAGALMLTCVTVASLLLLLPRGNGRARMEPLSVVAASPA